MKYKKNIFSVVLFLFLSPFLLGAANNERYNDILNSNVYDSSLPKAYSSNVLEWTLDQSLLTSIWDGWEYNLDVPQLVTAEANDSYYGFGLWRPSYDNLPLPDHSAKDWILDYGVNFSFGTEIPTENVRYRFDVRWHEDTDSEFLFQMQFLFK